MMLLPEVYLTSISGDRHMCQGGLHPSFYGIIDQPETKITEPLGPPGCVTSLHFRDPFKVNKRQTKIKPSIPPQTKNCWLIRFHVYLKLELSILKLLKPHQTRYISLYLFISTPLSKHSTNQPGFFSLVISWSPNSEVARFPKNYPRCQWYC